MRCGIVLERTAAKCRLLFAVSNEFFFLEVCSTLELDPVPNCLLAGKTP